MLAVSITESATLTLANVIALIVPLFIIAILVDSSKNVEQSGAERSPGKASVKQSRRTLLAIAVGIVVEVISLTGVLSIPNNDAESATPVSYAWLTFTSVGLLTIFYVMFVPHIELHMSIIRNDPRSRHWVVIVGWLGDASLLAAACVALLIGNTRLFHVVGYIFGVVWLIFTGAMLVITIYNFYQDRKERERRASENPAHPGSTLTHGKDADT
jgi:hypothetical protein